MFEKRSASLVPWLIGLAAVWLLNLGIQDLLSPYLFSILMYAGVNVILAVSLNLVNGFTGQFSMGHAGFMSVGGYIAAFIMLHFQTAHPAVLAQPLASAAVFCAALFLGGLGASAVGYLVGLPSLRLKGDYLAIVTLGFGEIIRVVVLNTDAIGGARGLPNIPPLTSFGLLYSIALITIFWVWRLIQAPAGRELLSVREDEIAAESMGVYTTRAKVRAFVTGAFFAGVAGGLFAHFLRYLNPQTFDFNRSFEIIIMVVLGGMGSVTGSVFAAFFLTGIREALRSLQDITQVDLRMIIYSLLLIILMLTKPHGLFGTRELADWLPRKKGGKA